MDDSLPGFSIHGILQARILDWVAISFSNFSSVAQSCPTLCDPMHYSLTGFSIHGILQARILQWVIISFSRGSSRLRDRTRVSHIGGRHFNLWATREDGCMYIYNCYIFLDWSLDHHIVFCLISCHSLYFKVLFCLIWVLVLQSSFISICMEYLFLSPHFQSGCVPRSEGDLL